MASQSAGTAAVRLRGSSWDHPRGHAPMLATAAEFEVRSGGRVAIEWVPRTLKDFGMVSVEELAQRFDFIVMDHPHIGTMAESGCVVALDELLDAQVMETLAANSPGRSHQSYRYGGHQWALAIDAACQTSAWRPDRLSELPRSWGDVIALAEGGEVMWPLCAVDSAASFMTLTMAFGEACATRDDVFVSREAGRWAMATMYEVARRSDPICLTSNPIDVLEALAHSDSFTYSPLGFCYVNYSREDHSGHRVAFGEIPSKNSSQPPRGSLLGGAGLAISTSCASLEDALEYALYVASPRVQSGLYYSSGGQPAHHAAWADERLNVASGNFFAGVSPVIANSWTRPNGPRFAAFQNGMIQHFAQWYPHGADPDAFLDQLDRLFVDARVDAGGRS